MSLVEKWDDMARKNHALVDAHGTGEKTAVAQAMGAAYLGCTTDLNEACTPRAPKAEWFGTPFDVEGKPTGEWDAWWVVTGDGCGYFWKQCSIYSDPDPEFGADNPMVSARNPYSGRPVEDDFSAIVMCLPVAREGFPAPVGWHVVGG